MRRAFCAAGAVLLILAGVTSGTAAPIDDLLQWAPKQANALVTIDVRSLKNSPLGRREDWANRQESNYLAGVSSLPPTAELAMEVLHLDHQRFTPDLNFTVMSVSQKVDMLKMALRNNTLADSVGGCSIVALPSGAVVQLKDNVIGVGQVRDRQELSRRIKELKADKSVKVQPYLEEAARSAGPRKQIVMALDLEDVLGPQELQRGLSQAKTMEGKKDRIDSMVKSLSNLKGVQFAIQVTDGFNGELRVDFDQKSEGDHDLIRSLLFEVLDDQGLLFPEFQDWKTEYARNSLVLSGPLTQRSVLRVVTLINPNAQQFDPSAAGDTEEQKTINCSKSYFGAIQTLLGDLTRDVAKTPGFASQAKWHEWYARQIDRLSMFHVDGDVVKYGQDTSNRLRNIAMSLQGVAISQNTLETQRTQQFSAQGPSYGGYVGNPWYGGGGGAYYNPGSMWYNNNYQEVRTAQSQASGKGQQERSEQWNQINAATASIRAQFSSKYKSGL